VLKELFSTTKRIVIKIIPHQSPSIYKLELSHRHIAVVLAAAALFGTALVTFQVGAVHAAEAQIHKLQIADAYQHRQLIAFSHKTDDMLRRLKALQRNERDITRLTGISTASKAKVPDVRPVTKPSQTVGHVGASPQVSLWTRVRSWLSGGSDGGSMTFAAESTELAMIDFQLNGALADSTTLKAKAVAMADARREAALEHQRYLDAIPSMWPTDGYVSSGFGYRSYPDSEFHPGLDIVNDYGSPVYATASGVVSEAGWDSGYGYKVVIDHGNGYVTWYAHNSRMLVSPGDSVHKGEQIAEVGATGFATGPHCHYELLLWGQPIDPTPYLDGVPTRLAAAR
jgi:murein DD-endopeptidase MepM/ murein hydrolase activator NlpD